MASPLGNDGSRDSQESIHHGAGLGRPLSDTDLDLHDQATRSTVVMQAAPPAAEVEDDEDDLANYCPRCGIELSDPVNVGWCLRCGYCRYLENAKPIDPLEIPPDPELQEYVALLRVLGKQLKLALAAQEGGKPDPALADYMHLIANLTQRCRKPGQTSASMREYADLLRQLGQRINDAQAHGTTAGLGAFEDLLQAMSRKHKAEMNASHRQGSGFLSGLGLPIPALEIVPEWLAVLACGLLICAIISFTARVNLRGTPEIRAVWCEAQAGLGGVMVLLSHPAAFLAIVPYGLRRNQWGLLIHPRDLWWAVWQRLPDSSFPVWLAGWGLGLALGALVVWTL